MYNTTWQTGIVSNLLVNIVKFLTAKESEIYIFSQVLLETKKTETGQKHYFK